MPSKNDRPDKSPLKLNSLIEEALKSGADSIELEYVPEGLEVTYMFGNMGIGEIIDDRSVIREIVRELIREAKLEHQTRGTLQWTSGGKSYKIRVEEYESFGESTFRLVLSKSKQRRARR